MLIEVLVGAVEFKKAGCKLSLFELSEFERGFDGQMRS